MLVSNKVFKGIFLNELIQDIYGRLGTSKAGWGLWVWKLTSFQNFCAFGGRTGARWILRGRYPAGPPLLMEENYLKVESEASKSGGGPTFLVENEASELWFISLVICWIL